MRTTQQLSITLPNEMADVVRAKVATGEYATESEVIREGLRTLLARDRAVEGLFCWRPRRDLNPCYRRERPLSTRNIKALLRIRMHRNESQQL
jgi:hypothetical protein